MEDVKEVKDIVKNINNEMKEDFQKTQGKSISLAVLMMFIQ